MTLTETKIASITPKLTQEYTQVAINFMIEVIDSFLHKDNDRLDPTYPKQLMDHLFGDDEQKFLNCVCVHVIKIFPSEEYAAE